MRKIPIPQVFMAELFMFSDSLRTCLSCEDVWWAGVNECFCCGEEGVNPFDPKTNDEKSPIVLPPSLAL